MMHLFMQLEDKTEIVHSDIMNTKKGECVKVYIEKPILGGFQSAICYLPDYRWEGIEGFSDKDIEKYQEILESTAHLIIRFAKQGGLGNAANI